MYVVAGVGNMPDLPQQGWLPWLRQQRKKGLQVCLCRPSPCMAFMTGMCQRLLFPRGCHDQGYILI